MLAKVSPEGSLTITNVSKEDEGVYRCSATNPLGNLSAIAEVRVASKLEKIKRRKSNFLLVSFSLSK